MKIIKESQVKPKGTAKSTFNVFFADAEKHNYSRRTLASVAFDAGHSLRHSEHEWINIKDGMPPIYKPVLINFKGKLSRIKGKVTEGWWNGEYWDCFALLVGQNEKITVIKWMSLPTP